MKYFKQHEVFVNIKQLV